MKKIFIFISILFVVSLGGVLGLYKFLNPESYQKQIISALQQATGRQSTISGGISLSLFPTPKVILSDIAVKNKTSGKSENIIFIKKAIAITNWKSLFKEPIVIESLELDGVEINLETDHHQNNWAFPLFLKKDIIDDRSLGKPITDIPPYFKLIQITNGQISYTNMNDGQKTVIDNINGTLLSDSFKGPFTFTGKINLLKNSLNTTFNLAPFSETSPSTFDLSLTHNNNNIAIKGNVESLFRHPKISATLLFDINDLSEFQNTNFPIKTILGTSDLTYSMGELSFSSIALKYGMEKPDNEISGQMNQKQKEIEASFVISNLDLNNFLKIIRQNIKTDEALSSLLRQIKQNVNLKISAQNTKYNEQTISNIDLDATYKDGIWTINRFNSNLPFNINLSSTGQVRLVQNPELELNFHLPITEAESFLNWLKIPNGKVFNTSMIKSFDLKGILTYSKNMLKVSDISGYIDNTEVSGKFSSSKEGGNIWELDLKNIDFDNYVSNTFELKQRTWSDFLDNLSTYIQKESFWDIPNTTLKLGVNSLLIFGNRADTLTVDLSVKDKNLIIKQLDLKNIVSSDFKFSGEIKNTESELSFSDFNTNISSSKPTDLLKNLYIDPPENIPLSNLSLNTTLNGKKGKLDIKSDISLSQITTKFTGTLLANAYRFNFSLTHPNFIQFMKIFDKEYTAFPALNGIFIISGDLSKSNNLYHLKNSSVQVGTQRFNLDLTEKENHSYTGSLNADLFILDKVMPVSSIFKIPDPTTRRALFNDTKLSLDTQLSLDIKANINKAVLNNQDLLNMSFVLQTNPKEITLKDITFGYKNGKVKGNLSINTQNDIPKLTGNINIKNITLKSDDLTIGRFRLKKGKFSSTLDFNASGNTIAQMVSSLSGTGNITISSSKISGIDAQTLTKTIQSLFGDEKADEKKILDTFKQGETNFNTITSNFQITDGVLTDKKINFKSAFLNSDGSLKIDFPNWTIDSVNRLSLIDLPQIKPFDLTITSYMNNPDIKIDVSNLMNEIKNSKKVQIKTSASDTQKQTTFEQSVDLKAQAEKLIEETSDKLKEAQEKLKDINQERVSYELILADDSLSAAQNIFMRPNLTKENFDKIQHQLNLVNLKIKNAFNLSTTLLVQQSQNSFQNEKDILLQKFEKITQIWSNLPGVITIDEIYRKAENLINYVNTLEKLYQENLSQQEIEQLMGELDKAGGIMNNLYEKAIQFDVSQPLIRTQETGKNLIKNKKISGKITIN